MAGDTLTNLQTRIRRRADRENDSHIADAELVQYINGSGRELHDLLIAASADYFLTSATFTLTGTTDTYAVPAGMYKLRGVDFLNGTYQPLPRFSFHSRNRDVRRSYRVMGAYIRFIPEANAAGSYRLWYEQGFTALSSGSDTLDDALTPWDEYIVIDGAIKCGGKSEEDVSVWMAEKQAMVERIKSVAANRDDGAPDRVTDIYTAYVDDFDGI